MINVKKDLELMGSSARKKSLSHLYLLSDNKEFAFFHRAKAILTGRFSFEREAILFIVLQLQSKYFSECEERITAVC